MSIRSAVRWIDGVTIQAVIAGSLSFAHIHELAIQQGQTGWKGWMYPLSVDLLMVAAWGRLRRARRAGDPVGASWFWFLLALAASLAANVASCGPDPTPRQVAVAVWPAVAFLGTTLLGHGSASPGTEAAPEPETVPEREPVRRPELELPVEVVAVPQPESEREAGPDPEPEPVSELEQQRNRKRAGDGIPDKHVEVALRMLRTQPKVSGTMIGEALDVSDSYGRRVLRVAKQQVRAVPEPATGTA